MLYKQKIKKLCIIAASILLLITACTPAMPDVAPEVRPASYIAAPNTATPIPLAYTSDYALFASEAKKEGGHLYGLMNNDRQTILPAQYNEISVAANGLIFTSSNARYQIFDQQGMQIGKSYNWIECASPREDGTWVYRQAAFMDMAPVAPYIADIEDANGKRFYWLLDENGLPTEAEPYDDIEIFEDSIAKCRGGVRYDLASDGSITKSGNEIVASYFNGKYLVKSYCPNVHQTLFSLLDENEEEIAPPKYSGIHVPFKDRYLLCEGDPGFMGGQQAFLYGDTNRLLASDSNGYSFDIQPDGGYVGVSYVGNPFENSTPAPIFGADNAPEPQGMYFVDKNGARLSERYIAIEGYLDETAFLNFISLGDGASYILSYVGGLDKLKQIFDEPSQIDSGSGGAFYLCLTAENKVVKIPLENVLIKS